MEGLSMSIAKAEQLVFRVLLALYTEISLAMIAHDTATITMIPTGATGK